MRFLFLFFIFFLASCALDDGEPSGVLYEYDLEHYGMVFIGSDGHSVMLGTNDSLAKTFETPAMNVRFSYPFSMSQNEVTQKEYTDLMGGEVEEGKENYPITSVTYYDAVLYANAKSKKEGFDTAYTYTSVIFDTDGNCSNLEDLKFNSLKKAYRLPTEAEWVFAASQHWNTNKAWNNSNSDYKTHEVCTADINSFSLCDMAGNVMEWVNDKMGNFKDTSLTNYIGALDENALGERILKGGSYNKTSSQIQLYSRGDVYTVTASTESEYVGFRLAFGQIPEAVYFDAEKSASLRMSHVSSLSKIKNMTRTYDLKLAFVNKQTQSLVYIDYRKDYLTFHEIVDTMDVYHPDISPDGNRVAFCTGLEGVTGSSVVYVRNLDPEGSDLVQLNVQNAAIPRWRVLPDGDTVIVYVSDAGNNKDEIEWEAKSTWQVPFSKGKFGTPVKLYDGSYHGGISEDGKLAVSGARILRANVNGKDTIWYNGEQACNVSLSKDGKKQTLFLDFASKTGIETSGSSYFIHERIWLADSTGLLKSSIAAPSGKTWDHTEWSNLDNIAVATIVNQAGLEEAIYLIQTSSGDVLKILEGSDVMHPALWGKKLDYSVFNEEMNIDSAGFYYTDANAERAYFELLQIKMSMFWKMKDTIDYVIWGSSRALDGIIPDNLTTVKSINMAHLGNRLYSSIFFLENYAFNHVPNLKGVIVGLDLDIWHGWDDFHQFFFTESKGFCYDQNHNFWKDGLPAHFIEWLDNTFPVNDDLYTYYINAKGFASYDDKTIVKSGHAELSMDSLWDEFPSTIISQHLDLLKSFIEKAKEKGVNVIGVITPQVKEYGETGAYGRYGLRRSIAKETIKELEDMDSKYTNFYFLDEYKMNDNDYSKEMFYDYDHLNKIGAIHFTSRLDSLLRSLP